MPKTITIQHPESGGRMPYPFHVNEEGEIQRQDFWKGHPLYAVGFASTPDAGALDLEWENVDWEVTDGLVGMYLVTEDKNSGWSTHTAPIAEVRVVESA